jgi:hypothetical protein
MTVLTSHVWSINYKCLLNLTGGGTQIKRFHTKDRIMEIGKLNVDLREARYLIIIYMHSSLPREPFYPLLLTTWFLMTTLYFTIWKPEPTELILDLDILISLLF